MEQKLLKSRKGETLASGVRATQLLLAASLALNIYLLFFRGAPVDAPELPPAPIQVDIAPPAAGETPPPEAEAEAELPLAAVAPTEKGAYQRLQLQVKGSIAQTFGQALGGEAGDLVSAFYSRIFMWDLDLKSDVRPDDELTLLYAIRDDGQVDIPVASYKSEKNRTTYVAYHFLGDGQSYPQYYDPKGVEVASRLVNGPLDEYEQVTSLLKDRPTHKGIDFKTPVGTPVKAPQRGRITRVNWAHKFNGNCVEIQLADGTIAKFLHLDKLRPGIVAGKTVAAGEVIADSGNTGHSTAPHLHYQLEKPEGRILDPFVVQETHHLSLGEVDAARFATLREQLDAQLAGTAPPVGAVAAPAAPAPAPAAPAPAPAAP